MHEFIKNNKFNFLAILLLLCINIFIRKNIIFSGVLFEDDMIVTVKSIFGDYIYDSSQFIGWYVYSIISHMFSELMYIRLTYVILIVVNSIMLANILIQIDKGIDKNIIYLGVIFASVNPFAVEMVSFITGSYPLIGLFFGLLGLSFSNYMLGNIKIYNFKIITLILLVSMLFFASFQSANLMYLFPLMLLPIHYRILKNIPDNRFQFISLMIVVIAPYIMMFVYSMTYDISNHYNSMKGWTDYSVGNWFSQIEYLMLNIQAVYINSLQSIDVSAVLLSFIITLTFKNRDIKANGRSSSHLRLMLVLMLFSIVTIAAYLIVTRFNYRYVYVASIFMYILLFISVCIVVVNNRKMKPYLLLLVFVLLTININAYLYIQKKKFDTPSVKQTKLIKHINKISGKWGRDSQVIFVLDESIPSFTYGFNHWSTWFLRYHTNNIYINGLIGSKDMMKHNPFIEEYKDNDESYWYRTGKNENLKSVRKRMVGIVKSKPTFIYKILQNGIIQNVDHIVIKSNYKYSVYRANVNGVVLLAENMSLSEFSAFDSKYKNKYIKYEISSLLFEILGVSYDGMYTEFDSKKYISHKNVNKTTGSYQLSFFLKTNETDIATSTVYNNENPPMPIIFKPLVMYQLKNNRYKIFVGKQTAEFTINPDKWYRIEFYSDKEHATTTVKVNDIEILFMNEYYPVSSQYQLGKGFNERYWNGKISPVSIVNK